MTPREGGVSLLFDIWNFDCSCGCGGYIGAMCFGVFLNQFFCMVASVGGGHHSNELFANMWSS